MLGTHKEKKGLLGESKNQIFDCLRSNALNRSNKRDCSLLAHLFLSYHPIHGNGSGFNLDPTKIPGSGSAILATIIAKKHVLPWTVAGTGKPVA